MKMRKWLLATTASLALVAGVGGANASDLSAPAVKYSPAPQWSWQGFFVGGNLGYNWSTDNATVGTGTTTNFNCCGNFVYNASNTASGGPLNTNADGVIGGLQGGYNYQINQFVVGGVVDVSWSGLDGSDSDTYATTPSFLVPLGPGFNVGYPTNINVSSQWGMDWVVTLRARAGVEVLNPNNLLYITGGAAVANIKGTNTATINAPALITPGIIPGASGSGVDGWSDTKWGWVLGGGLETHLTGHWTANFEYLYMDFGDRDGTINVAARSQLLNNAGCPGFCPAVDSAGTISIHQPLTASLIRAGVNYKF